MKSIPRTDTTTPETAHADRGGATPTRTNNTPKCSLAGCFLKSRRLRPNSGRHVKGTGVNTVIASGARLNGLGLSVRVQPSAMMGGTVLRSKAVAVFGDEPRLCYAALRKTVPPEPFGAVRHCRRLKSYEE